MDEGGMNMFIKICKRYDLQPVQVFILAYSYAKDFRYDKRMDEHFRSFCREGRNGKVYIIGLPEVVVDYCLDILAERHKPHIRG